MPPLFARFAAELLLRQGDRRHTLAHRAQSHRQRRLRAGHAPQPFRLTEPVTVAVEFNQSDMADRAALCPGARRLDGKRVELRAEDMPAAYRGFRALLVLASI